MAAELAAAEARLASSQDVAHLRTAGEQRKMIALLHSAAAASASVCPLKLSLAPRNHSNGGSVVGLEGRFCLQLTALIGPLRNLESAWPHA